ncbi:MAG: hypothetical protein OQJ78_10465 [Ignavibacteriaceae bacterium]|nr:hypothetical protein [Ignavibacteriaceae bacterium]
MKHSNKYFTIIIVSAFFLILFGCATVEETLYLREAEVAGPLTTAPIHITDTTDIPSFTISPTFSYNTQKTFTGNIGEYSTLYGLDTSFVPSSNSMNWDVSTITAGINCDLAIFRGFALSFGVNYSGQEYFDAWGGNFGIGFFSYGKGIGFRMDAGLQIHSMSYDAYTVSKVVVSEFGGGREEYISFYHDIGESTHFDPYITLTFNTAYKNWPVNIFINGGYVIQTLFSFSPESSYYYYPTYHQTDKRGSRTAGFVALTPGIYLNISETTRVLGGCSFYFETQINNANPSLFILPTMQVDFTL